jgi:hypothetical protein
MVDLDKWTAVARTSVLLSLGFSAFCAGICFIYWLTTGEGNWSVVWRGSLNIAGSTALMAFVMGAFLTFAPETDRLRRDP